MCDLKNADRIGGLLVIVSPLLCRINGHVKYMVTCLRRDMLDKRGLHDIPLFPGLYHWTWFRYPLHQLQILSACVHTVKEQSICMLGKLNTKQCRLLHACLHPEMQPRWMHNLSFLQSSTPNIIILWHTITCQYLFMLSLYNCIWFYNYHISIEQIYFAYLPTYNINTLPFNCFTYPWIKVNRFHPTTVKCYYCLELLAVFNLRKK